MGVSTRLAASVLVTIVLIIITFQVLGDTASDVGYAADNITNNGGSVYPLTNFFKKKGVILLAFMAGIALTIIMAVLPGKK